MIASTVAAAPYLPDDDAQVLYRLPVGAVSARLGAVAPIDAGAAALLARAWIERSRREGDLRFLGYAEGALAPWSAVESAPAGIPLLRATILQSRHRFDEALQQLDRIIVLDPGNAQAVLTRATVLRVQGRFPPALEACRSLSTLDAGVVSAICIESLRGLSGELVAATAEMDRLSSKVERAPPDVLGWYLGERAAMAERAGKPEQALELYRRAIEVAPHVGLRAALADVLLSLGRPADALVAVGNEADSDAALLRRAIASRRLGNPDAALEKRLAEAYAGARLRGDSPHLREEARFELDIRGNAVSALVLAQQNWKVQREPDDALLLARAAAGLGNPSAAATLIDWLQRTSMQDVRLESALAGIPR